MRGRPKTCIVPMMLTAGGLAVLAWASILAIAMHLIPAVTALPEGTAVGHGGRPFPLDRTWLHNLPPEASFMLPRRHRELGLLYRGAQERLRIKVNNLLTGEEEVGIGQWTKIGLQPGVSCVKMCMIFQPIHSQQCVMAMPCHVVRCNPNRLLPPSMTPDHQAGPSRSGS